MPSVITSLLRIASHCEYTVPTCLSLSFLFFFPISYFACFPYFPFAQPRLLRTLRSSTEVPGVSVHGQTLMLLWGRGRRPIPRRKWDGTWSEVRGIQGFPKANTPGVLETPNLGSSAITEGAESLTRPEMKISIIPSPLDSPWGGRCSRDES